MQKTQTVCLVILATLAIGFSLFYLKTVLLPFVISVFIVIGCRPVLEFVESRLKLHRYVAFAFSFLIGLVLLLIFSLLTWISIDELATNSDAYRERMNNLVVWVVKKIPHSSENEQPSDTADPQDPKTASFTEDGIDLLNDPAAAAEELRLSISNFVQNQIVSFAGSLSNLLSFGILILIFVFFLLLGAPDSNPSDPAGDKSTPAISGEGIVGEIEDQIRKYLLVKTVISALTGIAFGFALWLFGIPLAIVFGFLAFLLNFIPNIGPLISSCLPVPFLVLNSEMSPVTAISCFLTISSIQFVSGNVIETRIMGKSFDVSPIVLLLALMFFGLVWGILGMFLATPIVSIIKIIFKKHESTRPFAELMAGRLSVVNSIAAENQD